MEPIITKLVDGFAEGKVSRRQLIQTLAAITTTAAAVSAPGAAAAAESGVIVATNINHLAYQVSDYARTRDFYAQLFGMKIAEDNGKVARLSFGDNLLVVHNGEPAGKVEHIGYTLANWDTQKEAIKAEIESRGIKITQGNTKTSLYVQDPDGFRVQMGGLKQ